jgi:hypothetical protein
MKQLLSQYNADATDDIDYVTQDDFDVEDNWNS